MKRIHLPCVSVAALLAWTTCTQAAEQPASVLLREAVAAQGGEQALRAIESVQWQFSGYRNQLEQSERPQGPYITEFLSVSEIHDLKGGRYRRAMESTVYPVYKSESAVVVAGGVVMRSGGGQNLPGTAQQGQLVRERMALSPERLLITALEASDAHSEADTVLQSVPQNVVTFTLDEAPARIYLNAYTHLPTAVDYSGPLARSGFWAYFGDGTLRTYYGFWWLGRGGVRVPLQWNMEENGLPDQMLVVSKLRINEALDEAALRIPEEVRSKYQPDAPPRDLESLPLGDPRQPAKELAPGLVLVPGAWNATFVRQEDGIVVLEAPISSGYSAKVIAEAQRRFPGEPIKAVVTTSDSWPHVGGIREYVAQKIPIYALDLNKPLLERFLAAQHTSHPDTLQKEPRKAVFHLVSGKTVLGTGANRMELYPIRGETSERQMMGYFPEHRLLYGSDPFQRGQDGGFFYPQTVSELSDAVGREHLRVDQFFMMHLGPTPWSELGPAIEEAKKKDTPTGTM